jgi:hypothetical protein
MVQPSGERMRMMLRSRGSVIHYAAADRGRASRLRAASLRRSAWEERRDGAAMVGRRYPA